MARTPIPPSARAARNSSTSARRKRCAMLTFSCFLFLTTGFAEVVLTDCIHQRYPIARRKATPPQSLGAGLPKNAPTPSLLALLPATRWLVATRDGGYTVALWGAFRTPIVT